MSASFYRGGLRFRCTRCSACCRVEPGYVFLSSKDIRGIARALDTQYRNVIRDFCRIVDLGGFRRISLREKANYDCVFWHEDVCDIYPHRPLQCRSFPFWASNLNSRDAWDMAAESCPGIGKGRNHTRQEIDSWLRKRLADPYLDLGPEDREQARLEGSK